MRADNHLKQKMFKITTQKLTFSNFFFVTAKNNNVDKEKKKR